VITGAHAIVFTKDAKGSRAFFRDVLGLSSVDAGAGWLIFALPAAELAAHPAEEAHHEIYLMCDDVHATVTELTAKGVKFTRPITETDWGRMTALQLPGGDELAIYEPKHPSPLSPTR
jgi:predicted enzyme related to lactoylglutathione lyase